VSEIQGVDPLSYALYLNLLGIELTLDLSSVGGLVGGLLNGLLGVGGNHRDDHKAAQTKETLVHQYRVRCGVSLPPSGPVFPGFSGGEEHSSTVPDGHQGCLETCEREAITHANSGLLKECLGVAYRANVEGVDAAGECRYWVGDKKEHEFLPVDSLPSNGDQWEVVYV
jgi:hypothetical protein